MATKHIAVRADSRNLPPIAASSPATKRTSKQAIYLCLAALAVCAAICDSFVPARHPLPIRIAADLVFGAVAGMGFPLLAIVMWREGPGTFARWVFWTVAFTAFGAITGALYLTGGR
jgi:hypothetical protein